MRNGILSATMMQSWFPMHAEVWNSPSWFLSALSFAIAVLSVALPILGRQSKDELRRSFGVIFLLGLLPKLGYCYDHNAWSVMEGITEPRMMPSLSAFNAQRFSPFMATFEVLLGAIACRWVMVEEVRANLRTPPWSTSLPLAGMLATILLRASGAVAISDLLARHLVFVPLFLQWLVSIHRAGLQSAQDSAESFQEEPKKMRRDPLIEVLSNDLLVRFGGISFPIFVLHGPIGQVFYKKVVATRLFGGPLHLVCGPWFFWVYLLTVLVSAWVTQRTFLRSRAVAELSKAIIGRLTAKA